MIEPIARVDSAHGAGAAGLVGAAFGAASAAGGIPAGGASDPLASLAQALGVLLTDTQIVSSLAGLSITQRAGESDSLQLLQLAIALLVLLALLQEQKAQKAAVPPQQALALLGGNTGGRSPVSTLSFTASTTVTESVVATGAGSADASACLRTYGGGTVAEAEGGGSDRVDVRA